jgi:hypothetical protein
MAIKGFTPTLVEESKFVDVLTSEFTGDLVGYRIGGCRPGPNAVVAGDAILIDALFGRYMDLPTLPWLWGSLYLVVLDSAHSGYLPELTRCLDGVTIDGLVMLPYAPSDGGHDRSVDSGYWAGLRLCRQLGMIGGRGIPPDTDGVQGPAK